MMQLRLVKTKKERKREDYPQINYTDKKGVQWIEINRGCRRQCAFCYADPNYKTFKIPKIISNRVQIIGEGILYDKDIDKKIRELGRKRVNDKVVYYGLSQGIDFRLLSGRTIKFLSKNRFGIINNKGNWYKGIRFAWDLWGKNHEKLTEETIKRLSENGYQRRLNQVFVLTNWKISYEKCLYKLNKLKEWGVKIDDCTWDTTKKEKLPLYWTKEQLIDFRRKSRKHNQLVLFGGFDPEKIEEKQTEGHTLKNY